MPTFEVMVLDRYTIEESTRKHQLIAKLRVFANVAHDELQDSDLAAWLWAGAKVLLPNIVSWDEVTDRLAHGLVLYGAIAITDHRMLASALYFPIDSRVGSTDPSKRVSINVQIKQVLLDQWKLWLSQAGITLSDEITQSDLYRRDWTLDANIPDDTDFAPAAVTLKLLAQATTTVTVQWNQSNINDFSEYRLYIDTQPALKDLTRMAEDDNPGVRDNVTLAGTFLRQHQVAATISGLTAGAAYWCVLTVADLNGKVSVSNELAVQL